MCRQRVKRTKMQNKKRKAGKIKTVLPPVSLNGACYISVSCYANDGYTLNIAKQVLNVKGRHDKKAFRRLLNVLLSLFDIHISERHTRLKVSSGESGLIFVAFKRFFIMSSFHILQLPSLFLS